MSRLVFLVASALLLAASLVVVGGSKLNAAASATLCTVHKKIGNRTVAVKEVCPSAEDKGQETPTNSQGGCPTAPGNECQTPAGVWFSRYACYAHPMPTQPAPVATVWAGHTKNDGSIYVCASVPGTAPLLSTPFFVANGSQPKAVTAGMVWRLVKRLTWPKADLHIQPSHGWTLVNLPTAYYSTTSATIKRSATLLNQHVEVEMTPSAYHWIHGDGTTQSTHGPGRPVTEGRDGAANLTGRIIHQYEEKGPVSVRVDLSYSGRWRANGGPWHDLPRTLTVTGDPQRLLVRTATPHLTG